MRYRQTTDDRHNLVPAQSLVRSTKIILQQFTFFAIFSLRLNIAGSTNRRQRKQVEH